MLTRERCRGVAGGLGNGGSMVRVPGATDWRDQRRAEPNGTVEEQAERELPFGGAMRLPTRLERTFGALERSGERWCLLRPAAMLAKAAGDIDILVEPSSRNHVREVLVGEGF